MQGMSSYKPERKHSGISPVQSIAGILFAWTAGAAIAYALHIQLPTVISFAVQYIVFFLHALPNQSEHLYDFTGGITNFSVVIISFLFSQNGNFSMRNVIATTCAATWAARLGLFLFDRIQKTGRDSRFNLIKKEPLTFMMAWSLQGLWVQLTTLPVLVLNCHPLAANIKNSPISVLEIAGWALFAFGFSMEVIADQQKSAFRNNPNNKDRFITTGLWAWSRHPNYFGEITLWSGLTLASTSVFPLSSLPRWLTWIGPAFVVVLLTQMSGIPMLERAANKKWGNDPEYKEYKRRTPVLIPAVPKPSKSGAKTN
jgi:steroid 5-alpha reductase family enzyme